MSLPAKAREALAGWASDDDIDSRNTKFLHQSLRMLDRPDIVAESSGEKVGGVGLAGICIAIDT
jgi:hypothetical protein